MWAALAAILAGCQGSSNGPESDTPFAKTETSIQDLDLEKATYTTREIHPRCDTAAPPGAQDTVLTHFRYRIAGGVLQTWVEGECLTQFHAQGSSPTLLGTWTSSEVGWPDSVPLDSRPAKCQPPSDGSGLAEIAKSASRNLEARFEISSEKLTTFFYGEICTAELEATFLFIPGKESRLENMNCSSVTLVNGNTGAKAVFTSRYVQDEPRHQEVSFSFAGKTCTKVSGPEETCAEEAQNDASQQAFKTCIQESGFLAGDPEGTP